MSTAEFSNVWLAGRAGTAEGVLRLSPSGVSWKKSGGGRAVEVDVKDLAGITWTTTSRGGHLTLTRAAARTENGAAPPPSCLQFCNLRSDDLGRVREATDGWASSGGGPALRTATAGVAGANWGALALEGGDLSFADLGGAPLFRLPLSDVASVQAAGRGDEVTLDLPLDDTVGGSATRADALVSIAFHVPQAAGGKPTLAGVDVAGAAGAVKREAGPGSREASPGAGPTPAAALAAALASRTAAGASTAGTPAAAFAGVALLAPRGRFDVHLYERVLTLSGAGGEYRVPYDAVVRALLLPRPHAPHTLVAIQVDPPVRRGQTYYPILLLQFRGDEVYGEGGGGGGGGEDDEPTAPPLTLALPPDVLAAKNEACGGRLPATLSGPAADVFGRALRGLANTKLVKPGAFRAAGDPDAAAIRASYKADDGYVYPLDRAFVYVPKPPVLVPYEDVASVEFVRRGAGGSAALAGAQKTFDLAVRLTARAGGGDMLFRGIAKAEWTNLYEWVTARGLAVENADDAAAGPGGGGGGGGGRGPRDESSEDADDADFGGSDDDDDDDESSGGSSGGGGGGGRGSDSDASSSEEEEEKPKKKKKAAAPPSPASAGPAKKKAKKAKKDPNAPKGAKSAFMLFSIAKRPELVAAAPPESAGIADIGRAAGAAWRALSDEDKKPWEAAAAEDKARYEREMATYKAQAGGSGGPAAAVKAEPSAGSGGGGGGGDGDDAAMADAVEVKDE